MKKLVQVCDPDNRSGEPANAVPHCFTARTIKKHDCIEVPCLIAQADRDATMLNWNYSAG